MIINGLSAENDGMKKAAINALIHSLDFTGRNFEVDTERDAIMNAIFGAIQSQDVKVRELAYQCLSYVATDYYRHMRTYMERYGTIYMPIHSLKNRKLTFL